MTSDEEFYLFFTLETVATVVLFYLFYRGLLYINKKNSETKEDDDSRI